MGRRLFAHSFASSWLPQPLQRGKGRLRLGLRGWPVGCEGDGKGAFCFCSKRANKSGLWAAAARQQELLAALRLSLPGQPLPRGAHPHRRPRCLFVLRPFACRRSCTDGPGSGQIFSPQAGALLFLLPEIALASSATRPSKSK